jgi:hypothetical protein
MSASGQRKSPPVDIISALPGGLNRSTQHFIFEGKDGVWDGTEIHRRFVAAEKKELWERWKCGDSLKAIDELLANRHHRSIFLVAPHGGIRPAERRRSRLALTLSEREEISRGTTAHQSARSIAKLRFDGEPGNEPQRRPSSLPGGACG